MSRDSKTKEILVPARAPKRFFGHGIPGVDVKQLTGKLVVI